MEAPNLSYINSLSGNDEAFKTRLIDIIKIELPKEIQNYVNNIAAGNFKEAAANVHKLKHKISILGLEESYKVAESYEDSLLEQSRAEQVEFENILKIMTSFITTI